MSTNRIGIRLTNRHNLWKSFGINLPVTAHSQRFASVTNDLVGISFRSRARAVAGRDKDNPESPFLQHAGERSGSLANRQLLRRLVPRERNCGKTAFFIIIRVTLVLVEREFAVRPGINAQFDGRVWLLVRVLHAGPERHDRAGLHEQG